MIRFRAFQLHHYFSIHQQIQPLILDHDVLVNDLHFLLADKRNPSQGQFVAQGFLIDGFEKSGAQMAVHFDGRANDAFRDGV